MKRNPEFRIISEDTLLEFLLKNFPNKSRNYVKGVLKRGQVSIDGKSCTNYARALRPGQTVSIKTDKTVNFKLPFPILYEDNELIVIDKPAGMLPVSTDKEKEHTAYHLVREYLKSKATHERAFIVHRLDRDTSGVMLLAKDESLKMALQDEWEDLAIKRGYTAVVEGDVIKPKGRIQSWLKQTKTLLVYSSQKKGDGKLAITEFYTRRATQSCSLLDIIIKTGRKNQIRVHMSDMGHPIAGDKKYGAETDPLKRLCLHASELVIKHPFSENEMCFESKPIFLEKLIGGK